MGVKESTKILMVWVLPKPTNPMIPVRRNQRKWKNSQGTEDLVRDHANVTVLADLATGRVREHADLRATDHVTGHAETDLETEDDDLGQETDVDPDQGNGKDQDIRSD